MNINSTSARKSNLLKSIALLTGSFLLTIPAFPQYSFLVIFSILCLVMGAAIFFLLPGKTSFAYNKSSNTLLFSTTTSPAGEANCISRMRITYKQSQTQGQV